MKYTYRPNTDVHDGRQPWSTANSSLIRQLQQLLKRTGEKQHLDAYTNHTPKQPSKLNPVSIRRLCSCAAPYRAAATMPAVAWWLQLQKPVWQSQHTQHQHKLFMRHHILLMQMLTITHETTPVQPTKNAPVKPFVYASVTLEQACANRHNTLQPCSRSEHPAGTHCLAKLMLFPLLVPAQTRPPRPYRSTGCLHAWTLPWQAVLQTA